MSVQTTPRPAGSSVPESPGIASTGRLPRWAPWAAVVAATAVSFGVEALGDFNITLAVIYTIVLATVLIWATSRLVEGRRRATDRLVTSLVTAAFCIAMVPLVSLVVEVVRRGAERLDAMFFTWSMVGVIGEGGGAYHALVGTLIVTALTAVMSVPIGLMTAI
jgi:phosphate transport system permease protein